MTKTTRFIIFSFYLFITLAGLSYVSYASPSQSDVLQLTGFFMNSSAGQDNLNQIDLIIRDEQGNLLPDHLLFIDIKSEDYMERQEKYLGEDSVATLLLEPGRYSLMFSTKKLSSDTDYYFLKKIFLIRGSENYSVFLMPVAQLRGVVIDKYDNLIPEADLMFQCNSLMHGSFPEYTDEVGSFFLKNVPLGKCRIFASYGSDTGFADLNIKENRLYDLSIVLNKKRFRSGYSVLLAAFFLLFVVLAFIFFINYKKRDNKHRINMKRKKQEDERSKSGKDDKKEEMNKGGPDGSENADDSHEENIEEGHKELLPSKRMNDFLRTLNDNERAVMQYLLDNNGSATQSRIRQHTGIPKTSLFRCIKSLEKKNLVITESIGKMKTVYFTDFFLSGTDKKEE